MSDRRVLDPVDLEVLTVRVSLSHYSEETIFRACHHFTGEYYLRVASSSTSEVEIEIRPRCASSLLKHVVREFENQLIDERVRQDLRAETARIRELIVAQAFAEGDFRADSPPMPES